MLLYTVLCSLKSNSPNHSCTNLPIYNPPPQQRHIKSKNSGSCFTPSFLSLPVGKSSPKMKRVLSVHIYLSAVSLILATIFFFFNFYLFMIVTERERERERGRDTGRGRSRLHAPGARRGIRSRVSRITPWAKGRR